MTPSVKEALIAGMAGRGPHGRPGAHRAQIAGKGGAPKTEIVVVMALEDLKYSLCNWTTTKPIVGHIQIPLPLLSCTPCYSLSLSLPSLPICLCVPISVSLCLSLYLSLSVCFSLFLSVSLSPSVSFVSRFAVSVLALNAPPHLQLYGL